MTQIASSGAAAALDYAHQSGILHRDIKPANLLLDEDSKLWIADFGLAHMETDVSLTMTGDILGTLRYMAPEQALAQREVVDHRSDIYSLGATLYELLTLEPAFGETDRAMLLQQIARDEPQPPRKLNARIPLELETIVLKAMRKSAQERYATAQALADDLQNFLDDKPIEARPPTPRERLMKWSRRHPAATWSTLLVFVATTIVSAASAVVVGQAYQREAIQRALAEKESKQAVDNFYRAREAVSDLEVSAANGDGPWGNSSPEMRTWFSNRAIAFYKGLLQTESDDLSLQYETAVGFRFLAVMHDLRKEYDPAEKLLRKSVEILDRYPDVVAYRQERAYSYFLLSATLYSQEKYTEVEVPLITAINLYKQLIEEQPEAYPFFPELRVCLEKLELVRHRQGEEVWDWTDEAIPVFRAAIQRAPENFNAHYEFGLALR